MWKILSKEDIFDIWLASGGSKQRIAYAMSILTNRELIFPIIRGFYGIGNISEDELDQRYWDIVSQMAKHMSPAGYLIASEKSLELHMQNFSIPETLIIYTRDVSARVRIFGGREIHFRTLHSGEKTKKINLFRIFQASRESVFFGNISLSVISREASLLDALSLRQHDAGIEEGSVLRFLRQHEKKLRKEIFSELVKYRYIRAVNRLRQIARDNGYENLYEMTKELIRNEGGGCFLRM